MKAIVTCKIGNYDVLLNKTVPIPTLKKDEVLVKVLSTSVNNTDINTRVGWYSKEIKIGTNLCETTVDEYKQLELKGWNNGLTPFPLIQGTDCCGIVIKIYDGDIKNENLLNKRVIINPCDITNNKWLGSDYDGTFCEFVKVNSSNVFIVKNEDLSNAELGVIPCVYGTSENMLVQTNIKKGQNVLINGASGGVGVACIQLLIIRGIEVLAITSIEKVNTIRNIGCSKVFTREDNLLEKIGENSVDVIIDNVGGDFNIWTKLLKNGGKIVTSGAIGNPLINIDIRDLYLKDLQIIGCTSWDKSVFPNLISYIEKGAIKPIIYKEFSLFNEIVDAQKEFLKKKHVGKIALCI